MNQNVRNAMVIAVLLLGMGVVWFVVAGLPLLQRSISSVQTPVSSTASTVSTTIATTTSTTAPIPVGRTLTIPSALTNASSSTIRVIIEEDSARWRQQSDKRIECMIAQDRVTVQPGLAITSEAAASINRRLLVLTQELMTLAAKTSQDSAAALQSCLELAAERTDGNPYQQNEYVSADALWNKAPYLSVTLRYYSTVSDATERSEIVKYVIFDARTGQEIQVTDLIRSESLLTFYRRIAQVVMEHRADLEGDRWRQDPLGWKADVMSDMEQLVSGSEQQARAALARLQDVFTKRMRYGLNYNELVLYFPQGVLTDEYEGPMELELPAARVHDIAVPDLQVAWGPK